jgi:outer membrane biosynthesis protein TonB
MRAVISREGGILNLEVLNTDVDPDLAAAAKDAVSKWRWQPTLLNGEPVEVITEIEINFTLLP